MSLLDWDSSLYNCYDFFNRDTESHYKEFGGIKRAPGVEISVDEPS